MYYNPLKGLVLLDYRSRRSRDGPNEMLKWFKEYLQSVGYSAYDNFSLRNGIIVVGWFAHVRRYFVEAKEGDGRRAEQMLSHILQIYAIERQAREKGLGYEEHFTLRLEQAVPILDVMKNWLTAQCQEVLPMGIHSFGKSLMGKAIGYMLNHWERLNNYLLDCRLEIDNNLVENAIRPLALGRKNYLFAGSHKGAKRAALVYSMVATAKLHEVEPFEYLRDVIERISDCPYPG